jgi:repressor LexA
MKLSKTNLKVLDFIEAYIRLHGISPSYEVIAQALGMKAKSNVHRIVGRLESAGMLSKRKYKFCSLKLIDKSVYECSRL